MTLILDTSILIEIERCNSKIIEKLEELKDFHPAPPKLTFMSYFEFIYGLRNKSLNNKTKLRGFIEVFEVIQITKETANILTILKDKYELSLTDLLIASQVIETKGILITKDKDFEIINELDKVII